jgi:hypothetical protein
VWGVPLPKILRPLARIPSILRRRHSGLPHPPLLGIFARVAAHAREGLVRVVIRMAVISAFNHLGRREDLLVLADDPNIPGSLRHREIERLAGSMSQVR